MNVKDDKIEFNDDEVKLILNSLKFFRNALVKEDRYTNSVDDVLVRLRDKEDVYNHDLVIILNALKEKKNDDKEKNIEIKDLDNLILNISSIYKDDEQNF